MDKFNIKSNVSEELLVKNPKIIAKNVNVYYNEKKAISNISIDIGL